MYTVVGLSPVLPFSGRGRGSAHLDVVWSVHGIVASAYGGSYSSVAFSGNILNEIGVMRFLCNEIAMSDGFEKQTSAATVPKSVHANDVSLEI